MLSSNVNKANLFAKEKVTPKTFPVPRSRHDHYHDAMFRILSEQSSDIEIDMGRRFGGSPPDAPPTHIETYELPYPPASTLYGENE
ncbi:uncharacterized protein EAF01_003831 [Botrytis porri]|uniref:Uncharacterized protein n=1 Tax=Botrytis porri TaxID=87229 RepID=A0A4Z1KRS6_9HELO|nr:uncharacterized protein EAF01_003831 [Botrytis porri]KAF7908076.1 hypothetical protein EAF01_003831 [Botrytis porri]TGO84865.1 hypothetical protein BPOR_0457g00100 [Botrytis porri]